MSFFKLNLHNGNGYESPDGKGAGEIELAEALEKSWRFEPATCTTNLIAITFLSNHRFRGGIHQSEHGHASRRVCVSYARSCFAVDKRQDLFLLFSGGWSCSTMHGIRFRKSSMGRKDVKMGVRAAIGRATPEKFVENMPESPREKARRVLVKRGVVEQPVVPFSRSGGHYGLCINSRNNSPQTD